jgi:hypothetical protein
MSKSWLRFLCGLFVVSAPLTFVGCSSEPAATTPATTPPATTPSTTTPAATPPATTTPDSPLVPPP